MDEKLVNMLLLDGIRRGDTSFKCDDNVVDQWLSDPNLDLSEEIRMRVTMNLKRHLQDAAIVKSVQSLEVVPSSLGRLLALIRERARLTLADIATRLGKTDRYVREIEESDTAVPFVPTEEFAELMRVFHLKFSRVAEIVQSGLDPIKLDRIQRWPEAATNGLQPTNTQHRLEGRPDPSGYRFRHANNHAEERDSAESWLTNLQDELRRRGWSDLLG